MLPVIASSEEDEVTREGTYTLLFGAKVIKRSLQ